MRKLVEKDSAGRLTEVDCVALRREAKALLGHIDRASPEEEAKFNFRERLRPLVQQALDGKLKIPHTEAPYNLLLVQEGLEPDLPHAIQEDYFKFLCRIEGSPRLSSASVRERGCYTPGATEEIIDGRRYEWVDFEEPA